MSAAEHAAATWLVCGPPQRQRASDSYKHSFQTHDHANGCACNHSCSRHATPQINQCKSVWIRGTCASPYARRPTRARASLVSRFAARPCKIERKAIHQRFLPTIADSRPSLASCSRSRTCRRCDGSVHRIAPCVFGCHLVLLIARAQHRVSTQTNMQGTRMHKHAHGTHMSAHTHTRARTRASSKPRRPP